LDAVLPVPKDARQASSLRHLVRGQAPPGVAARRAGIPFRFPPAERDVVPAGQLVPVEQLRGAVTRGQQQVPSAPSGAAALPPDYCSPASDGPVALAAEAAVGASASVAVALVEHQVALVSVVGSAAWSGAARAFARARRDFHWRLER
jgi:hypothetical protein